MGVKVENGQKEWDMIGYCEGAMGGRGGYGRASCGCEGSEWDE